MRKTLFILLCLLWGMHFRVPAQSWQWGRIAKGAFIDSWLVAADSAGNVYGGAYGTGAMDTSILDFGSGVTLPPLSIGMPSFWVKYSSSGTPLWAGSTSGYTELFGLATDPSGNLIVFGAFRGASMQIGSFTLTNAFGTSGIDQYYLAKIDPTGSVLWAVNDGNTNLFMPGVYNYAFYGAVTTDATGNIYITSSYEKGSIGIGSTSLMNASPSDTTYDVFVAKYSPSGSPVWATSFGGISNEFSSGIAVDPSGDVYVSGGFYSSSFVFGPDTLRNRYADTTLYGIPIPNSFIVKLSPTGTHLWGQCAKNCWINAAAGIALDNAGNVYMTGSFNDSTITFGTDTLRKPYSSGTSSGWLAMYLLKYSPSGALDWTKTMASATYSVWGYSIATAPCGKVWVGGYYYRDAVTGSDTLHCVGGPDPVYLACYDNAGNLLNDTGLISGGDDQVGIACDRAGNVYICGDLGSSMYMVVGPDTLTNSTPLPELFYMCKYANKAPDTLHSYHDTTLCDGFGPVTLTPEPGYLYHYWSNSTTGATLSTDTSGTYYVYNYNTACNDTVAIDTFHVTYTPGPCEGGVATVAGSEGLQLFPNPAAGRLTIRSAGAVRDVEVCNLLGQTMLAATAGKGSGSAYEITLDVEALPAGVYLLRVNSATMKKFVKE